MISATASRALESIRCPTCGEQILITEALRHELAEQADVMVREELAAHQKLLATKEAAMATRELALNAAETQIEARVRDGLVAERSALEARLRSSTRAEAALELGDLRAAVAEKDLKLQELQQSELSVRREKREIEAAKMSIDLDVARRMDAERSTIQEDAIRRAQEEHRLKDLEKDRKLQDAVRMNDELRLKLQQGSQQTQGEVLEIELEQLLKTCFPLDDIQPVAKGVRGADVVHRIHTRGGHDCGTILWESKHTKNWSDGWIEKLKDDQRDAKADVAVLVSAVLPKDVSIFGLRQGVWVADHRVIFALATALRNALIEVAVAKICVAGRNEAMDALFRYVTGPEFRQRVEAVIGTFASMQQDLDEEKRVAARRWAKREKQIQRVVENTSSLYGDLQGFLGSSMPAVALLEPGGEFEGPEEPA